jgi:DNA polymerase I-like protein with 3'-5' exonuclease and polymerase domains
MYDLIRDLDSFSEISEIDPHQPVFCDTETCFDEGFTSNKGSGANAGGLYGKVRLFQFYQAHWEKAVIVDCMFIPIIKVLDILKPHFCIFHNGAYDLHTINRSLPQMWLPRKIGDSLYLARLKYYTKLKFSFYDCLKYASLADDLILGIDKKEEQKSDWSGALSARQKTYAAADVIYLARLYEDLKAYEESTVYFLDITNLRFAVKYSRNGMPINQKTIQEYRLDYITRLENTLENLPINPRSHVQCKEYLGSTSSDAAALTNLIQEGNERAVQVQEARHCLKALEYLGAYDRPLVKGFFQPCAALSGRFSCSGGDSFDHANLQQMPAYLHEAVEAPEGQVIVYKDYSGLELRMAVAYTGEPTMADLMRSGADMHTETAKYVFDKADITDLERTLAKVFNFGLVYGGQVWMILNTIKEWTGITMGYKEVKDLIEKWFNMYDYFETWHNMHKNEMKVKGYIDIETALGRKVRTYKFTDSLNFPIQGSSVEVQKTALGYLDHRYPDNHLIDTIHDSNILLSPKKDAEMWGNRLSECMVDAWHYVIEDLADPDIPMPHGFESGPIWTFH